MADPKAQSGKDIFSTASVQFIFDKTFPRDGLDPYRLDQDQDFYYAPTDEEYAPKKGVYSKINDEINAAGSNLHDAKLLNLSAVETLKTNLLSFFGIPNRLTRPAAKQQLTASQVLKNFIGYPNDDSHKIQRYAMYTGIVPLAILLINLTTIVFKTAFNMVKLVTEFLPLLIILGANKGITALYELYELDTEEHPTIGHIGVALLSSISYLAQGMFLIGRAITSPANSVRAAWDYVTGMRLGDDGMPTEIYKVENPFLRVLAGSLLVALSLATSFVVYAIAFPAAVHAIAMHTPALYNFIVNLFVNAASPFYSIGIVQHLSNAVLAVSQWSVTQILAHTVGNVVLATLDVSLAATAVAAVTIASIAENLRKPLANWWYQKRNPSFDPSVHSSNKGEVKRTFVEEKTPISQHKDSSQYESEDALILKRKVQSATADNKQQVEKSSFFNEGAAEMAKLLPKVIKKTPPIVMDPISESDSKDEGFQVKQEAINLRHSQ